jgi:eukaryotic-like serine/threonine-protein kinase
VAAVAEVAADWSVLQFTRCLLFVLTWSTANDLIIGDLPSVVSAQGSARRGGETAFEVKMGQPHQDSRIRFGVYELDTQSGELRKAGIRIRLQDQPLKVLIALLEAPGEVVTRKELKRRIWPEESFGDFDHAVNVAVAKVRTALGDSADTPRFVETLPRRGYRFIASVNSQSQPTMAPVQGFRSRWAVVASLVSIATLATASYFYFHRAPKLTDKDTIVLSDFDNKTGDPVFDGTLRQGLTVQLEQSPFLSLVSEQQMQQTLRLMGQSTDAKLTPEISREVCQRTGSTAVIDGSIAQMGTQYSLILKAVNCSNGESLTSTEAQASDKSHVLEALGKAASEIRNKLGESIGSVQKLERPLEMATTPSLEALQFFSLGVKSLAGGDSVSAMPLFQQAIKLDPNFAIAYDFLGISYSNLGEDRLASDNLQKAYELRERVSDRERLFIEAHYHDSVTGDLQKAQRAYEIVAQIYPRYFAPRNDLGTVYALLGQHDKALAEFRECLRLEVSGACYSNLVGGYINLNRLEEARATAKEAQAKKVDSPGLRSNLYLLAFLQNDAGGMTQQVAWAAGKPGVEDVLLALEANTAAYSGRLRKAREFSRRAMDSAERAEVKETAATYTAVSGLREALFGNAAEARQQVVSALGLSTGPHVQYSAALTMALVGNAARAQAVADDLAQRFPSDTVVQFMYLPNLHAQLALTRNNPSKAIELLQAAAPYELGNLYSAYVRGEAYLAARQGTEAAAEFQKILDHRGIVVNHPIGALAHLQIGRAYALQGDTAKARAAYQDFLTLWKDADPDIPILKQAKAEYAKLQ